MDARLDPAKYAGLSEGDAHVIRNAGGRASDDAIRSLVISYKLLGTREWLVIHHTDCGMVLFKDSDIRRLLRNSLGWREDRRARACPRRNPTTAVSILLAPSSRGCRAGEPGPMSSTNVEPSGTRVRAFGRLRGCQNFVPKEIARHVKCRSSNA
jgi:hypothetical protein